MYFCRLSLHVLFRRSWLQLTGFLGIHFSVFLLCCVWCFSSEGNLSQIMRQATFWHFVSSCHAKIAVELGGWGLFITQPTIPSTANHSKFSDLSLTWQLFIAFTDLKITKIVKMERSDGWICRTHKKCAQWPTVHAEQLFERSQLGKTSCESESERKKMVPTWQNTKWKWKWKWNRWWGCKWR